MKPLVRLAIITSFLIVSFQSPIFAAPQEDRWLNGAAGYDRALELQQQLNLPLVIYFYADWCPYCHSLERQYFPAAPVQEYLRRTVKVRINPEHGQPERQLASQYGVRGYPMFLVKSTPTSPPVPIHPFRRNGDLTPAQFARACNDIKNMATPALSVTTPTNGQTRAAGTNKTPKRTTSSLVTVSRQPNSGPQFVSGELPTVDEILAKYIAAVGGADAQRKLTTRVTKGTVYIPGLGHGGRMESYASAPNKSLMVMKVDAIGVVRQGFDGTVGWDQSGSTGVRTSTGTNLAALARDSDFYRDLRFTEHYKTKMLGKVKHGFREVYMVEATPKIGSPETFFFDVESGLLIRQDVMRQTSRGLVRSETYLSDWREVDGIKVPFKMTSSMPDMTFVFTLEEVQHNVPINEAMFRRPAK